MRYTNQREQKLLRDAWIKANNDGKIELTFADKKEAQKTRFALYKAVKKARSGLDPDPILTEAADNCSIHWDDNVLIIYRKELPAAMQTLQEQVEQPEMDESLAKAKALLEGDKDVPVPYYKRRGD